MSKRLVAGSFVDLRVREASATMIAVGLLFLILSRLISG
jgi:hypothetical protein